MKKGIYFTLDSIIAGGIVLTVIALASSFYIKEPSNIHLNYLSGDLIKVLSTLTVEEVDNKYINSLISDGTITDLDNTILDQIGEFWANDDMVNANRTVSNVTEPWIPDAFGFGIWTDSKTIYKREIPIKKSLVSSKKMISGISKGHSQGPETRKEPPTLWGPAIVEVRVWN